MSSYHGELVGTEEAAVLCKGGLAAADFPASAPLAPKLVDDTCIKTMSAGVL